MSDVSFSLRCPGCGGALRLPARLVGRRSRCTRCDALFTFDGERARRPREPEVPPRRAASWHGFESTLAIGTGLAVVGAYCLGWFLFLYDTTVPARNALGYDLGWRVHNVGLMNTRIVGALTGAVLLVAGILLATLGGRRSPDS